jgi:2-polyprenyl-6-methoxyphenol hydroxylase-like FAD-dependent oxidoreductase
VAVEREFQVIVVGAGLGGLATGRFLAGAGLDPVVVERESAVDAAGGPVELWPDAMTVLSWAGAVEAVRDAGVAVRTWSLRDADGGVERRLSTDGPPGLVAVEYGRLRSVLRGSLPPGTVRTGATVRAVDDAGDAVTVEFENGVVERFDAAVGADGARSTAREGLGGADPSPAGTTSVAVPLDRTAAVGGAVERWGDDGAVVRLLPTGRRPWCWFTVPSFDDPAAARASVVDRLGGPGWPSPDPAGGPDDAVVRNDLRVDDDVATGGRVALVGGAARSHHRLTGLGPTLALEDAAALAGALTGSGTSLVERIASYARRRRARVQRLAGRDGVVPPLDAAAARVPDALVDAAGVRSARLAASFAGTPPTPAVGNPLSDR